MILCWYNIKQPYLCHFHSVKEQEEKKGRKLHRAGGVGMKGKPMKKALTKWFSVSSCISQTFSSHTESLRGVTLDEERRQFLK